MSSIRAIALAAFCSVLPIVAQDSRPADAPASRPTKIDLRPRLRELGVHPRAQGARPTCSVFTVAGALDVAFSRLRQSPTLVSVEFLNWAKNRAIGSAHDGGFFHHILAGFEERGVCEEASMPYRPAFDSALTPSTSAEREAHTFAESGKDRIAVRWIRRWSTTAGVTDAQFDEIRDVLCSGWPVATGSGHSRLLVGYRDDRKAAGGGTFITQDSAVGGYAEVTYEFVHTGIFDAFWIETKNETKTTESRTESRSVTRD